MLRPSARASARGAAFVGKLAGGRQQAAATVSPVSRLMSTQSGDDAAPPTALAKLHLEDGTTLVGRSFGSHESMTGEVSFYFSFGSRIVCYCNCISAHISWFCTLLTFICSKIDYRLCSLPVWLDTPRR